jgi:serine/threonine protein kinase
MAPELLDNKQYSIKVDIYSFAVVLWEICSRKTPYSDLSSPMAIIKHVTIEHKRPNLGLVPADCPPDLIELMKNCWSHDPNERPCFSQIIDRLSKVPVLF